MTISTQAQPKPSQACIIWLHGLGANGQDMAGLAQQIPLAVNIHHVFLDAPIRPVTLNNHLPMRAWYDILGTRLVDRQDRVGILQSEKTIIGIIEKQMAEGFTPHQIFLAGFSQGGAMALFTGLRTTHQLGGIIGLSCYLPLITECTIIHQIPIFLAYGIHDTIVLPSWTKECIQWLRTQHIPHLSVHEYPMEHTLCIQEIKDLSLWINTVVGEIATH